MSYRSLQPKQGRIMDSHIRILPMKTEEDMEAKAYIHWQTWQETYGGLMPPAYLDLVSLDKCKEWAHAWPENTLLLKLNDQVIGFSCYGESRDPGFEGAGELIALYLLQAYQGRGLGLALMKATMAAFAEKEKVILWVLERNEKARRFYQRYGFSLDGGVKEGAYGKSLRMVMESRGPGLL